MCGRLHVKSDVVQAAIETDLGLHASVEDNEDLRPTQALTVISSAELGIRPQTATWGIKPAWSKRILINAKAETVAEKTTFRQAFQHHRCVVPCTGWFEWSTRNSGSSNKTKYIFQPDEHDCLYMAGILFHGDDKDSALTQLVTLTTEPNEACLSYHHRMPLLLHREALTDWLTSPWQEIGGLLRDQDSRLSVDVAA